MKKLLLPAVVALLAAGAPKGDDNAKDLKKMQGDWAMVSMIRDGQQVPDEAAQALFRTVKGNEYTVFRYDKPVAKGTFKLDASKKPKAIDLFLANAPKGAKPTLGIYEFDGEKLKLCYASPGKDRPAEFTSKEGTEQTMTVWEREDK